MLLTIDVGNTQTVIGLYDRELTSGASADAGLLDHWRIATDAARTADEHAVVIRGLLASSGYPFDVDGVAICAGVPRVLASLREMIDRSMDVDPVVIEPGVRTGMAILYDNPKEVGADRIVNSIAAFDRLGGPLICVDFGTATTFDAVDETGCYRGGAIAPGVGVALDALITRTAKLPRVEVARPCQAIGKNTVASIQSGVFYGYVGLVEGLVDRIRRELSPEAPDEVHVMATGGLANLIATECAVITTVDPLLTLAGLRILYERNT